MEVRKVHAPHFHPEQIILFGSHAYGTTHNDSDVDLLVVMPFSGHPAYKALEILEHINSPFAIDLLVRTPTELQQWRRPTLRKACEGETPSLPGLLATQGVNSAPCSAGF
ncbi:MAG: nucleotidyltransferase domain-containing protein [Chloroflexia bacterium]|nr:nucleotidyltransferase domain-containing protein [Chloroflexia bacterium]